MGFRQGGRRGLTITQERSFTSTTTQSPPCGTCRLTSRRLSNKTLFAWPPLNSNHLPSHRNRPHSHKGHTLSKAMRTMTTTTRRRKRRWEWEWEWEWEQEGLFSTSLSSHSQTKFLLWSLAPVFLHHLLLQSQSLNNNNNNNRLNLTHSLETLYHNHHHNHLNNNNNNP